MSKIYINHLLNHSSGLYDINRVNNVINGSMNISTQAKALKLIKSQKNLAFKPGTYFSFHESVTESVLMAEIVAKASGQSFAEFVKANIFEPLGMKNSLIRDDSNALLNNVALPYQQIEESTTYKKNEVEKIVFSWMTLLDKEILKVVLLLLSSKSIFPLCFSIILLL